MENISFSEWQKLDLRVGKILNAEEIAGADKLFRLEVDVGEENPRTILAGIKKYYGKGELVGKQIIVICNAPINSFTHFSPINNVGFLTSNTSFCPVYRFS